MNTTKLRHQEDLPPEQQFKCWSSMACVPLIDGKQREEDVADWLARLQDAGALVILKHRYMPMMWGDSAAWTVGIVWAPPTDEASLRYYGPGPIVRGVHLQERRQQQAVRDERPHVGGTTNGWYGRRVTGTTRVWKQAGDVFKLFDAEGPPNPLDAAPNGWSQTAYEILAHAARSEDRT